MLSQRRMAALSGVTRQDIIWGRIYTAYLATVRKGILIFGHNDLRWKVSMKRVSGARQVGDGRTRGRGPLTGSDGRDGFRGVVVVRRSYGKPLPPGGYSRARMADASIAQQRASRALPLRLRVTAKVLGLGFCHGSRPARAEMPRIRS